MTLRPWFFIAGILWSCTLFIELGIHGYISYLVVIGALLGIVVSRYSAAKIIRSVETKGEYMTSQQRMVFGRVLGVAALVLLVYAIFSGILFQPNFVDTVTALSTYVLSLAALIPAYYLTLGILVRRWENNQQKRLMTEGTWRPRITAWDKNRVGVTW